MCYSGGLAPDRCIEPKRDWLIRGPLFLRPAGKNEGAGARDYVTPQVVIRFSANTLSLASGA